MLLDWTGPAPLLFVYIGAGYEAGRLGCWKASAAAEACAAHLWIKIPHASFVRFILLVGPKWVLGGF